jgi:hypothetical protein
VFPLPTNPLLAILILSCLVFAPVQKLNPPNPLKLIPSVGPPRLWSNVNILQLYCKLVVIWSDLKNKPLVPLPEVPYVRINRLPLTSNVVAGAAIPIPTLPVLLL